VPKHVLFTTGNQVHFLKMLARSFAKIARSAGINDLDSISAGNSIIKPDCQ